LKDSGVRINFTLEFSARENVIVTRVARPDYLNVFLGKVGAYMINNKLGDGSGAGEKAVIASDGKIPVHSRWEKKISNGEIAPDTLLTLAGLASFTADQEMLDQRIRNIIG
jgi:hypothetical protein